MFFKKINEFGLGCVPQPLDLRDKKYEEVAAGAAPVDWGAGFDIEKALNFELPFKNQNSSLSCVAQATSYYAGILDKVETKQYTEVSSKAIYAQIKLPEGGAYIREGIKLVVNWGAVKENRISSYENGNPPSEVFMSDLSWKNAEVDKEAKNLQAKEYRMVGSINMEIVAQAIRDNYGTVGGLYVGNNGSWRTNEPTPSTRDGGHAIYFGKFGIDEKGKYIATPNSWGKRPSDSLHPDSWQKLREDYFNDLFMFNSWTLVDKPNLVATVDSDVQNILAKFEKKLVFEAGGGASGRMGVIVGGKLREISHERSGVAANYVLINSGNGVTIDTNLYNKLPKGDVF